MIKLSECIRLGALFGQQIRDGHFTDDNGGSCAIGAAFLAIGEQAAINGYDGDDWMKTAAARFPSLATPLEVKVVSRAGHVCTLDNVGEFIIHLNDICEWTREEIAALIVAKGWDCEAVLSAPAPVEEEVAVA